MLDAYTLLHAMNGIDHDDVLITGRELNYCCGKQSLKSAGKLWKTVIIAAIIVSLLCCTAYAIHLSFSSRQQAQLRQEYEVAENSVSSYEEFTVPEEPKPGITLLSTYNNGNIQRVYINVSPVPPEEVIDPWMQDIANDGRVRYLTYISSTGSDEAKMMAELYLPDREYAPEDTVTITDDYGNTWEEPTQEAKLKKYFQQAYDAETQSLTLECTIRLKDLPEGTAQTELHVYSMNSWAYPDERGNLSIDLQQQLHRDFGTITVDIVPPDTRKLMLDKPLEFTNPKDGCSGWIFGFELSSGQITWLMGFDDEVLPYFGSLKSIEDENEFREAFERQLSWIRCEDDILSDAKIVFKDGKSIPIPGSSGYTINNGIKHLHGASWDGTIPISDVTSVTIAGNSYTLPPIESTPSGG